MEEINQVNALGEIPIRKKGITKKQLLVAGLISILGAIFSVSIGAHSFFSGTTNGGILFVLVGFGATAFFVLATVIIGIMFLVKSFRKDGSSSGSKLGTISLAIFFIFIFSGGFIIKEIYPKIREKFVGRNTEQNIELNSESQHAYDRLKKTFQQPMQIYEYDHSSGTLTLSYTDEHGYQSMVGVTPKYHTSTSSELYSSLIGKTVKIELAPFSEMKDLGHTGLPKVLVYYNNEQVF